MKICPECNAQMNDEAVFCSNCGYNFTIKKEKSSKQIKVIILAIIIAVIILGIGKSIYDYMAKKDYEYKVAECTYMMLEGASDAEDACNKIVSVWNNSIWQTEDSSTNKYTIDPNTGDFYDDFNDSLNKLFDDSSFSRDLKSINDNLEEVNDMMRELQNPPSGCEQLHDVFMNFYDEYYELVNCAIDPRGSLNSYAEDFHDADEKAAKYISKLQVYFE